MQEIESEKFWTTSVSVEAFRLTAENIKDASVQLDGVINMVGSEPGTSFWYKGALSLIGEWVVKYADGRYSIFADDEFKKVFLSHDDRMKSDEKYAHIFLLVMGAMNKQDAATYHDQGCSDEMGFVAVETTKAILREI